MLIAFIADIHGNLEALNAVLADVDGIRPDQLYCVGDIVGYGPDPQMCLEEIRRRAIPGVVGNHDLAACGKLNVTYFNADAKRSIAWTNSRLSGDHLAYLEAFPFTVQDGAFAIAHGTLYYPERFGYILTALDADLCFAAHERRFAFVGHSHVPLTFAATDGDITVMTQPSVRFPDWTRAIVNVGSVGQPRDGDPRASYGLLDTDESRVEIRRIAYDVDACARKILAAGLPPSNAQRLAFGG